MAQYAYLIDIVPFRWDQQAQMGLGRGLSKSWKEQCSDSWAGSPRTGANCSGTNTRLQGARTQDDSWRLYRSSAMRYGTALREVARLLRYQSFRWLDRPFAPKSNAPAMEMDNGATRLIITCKEVFPPEIATSFIAWQPYGRSAAHYQGRGAMEL